MKKESNFQLIIVLVIFALAFTLFLAAPFKKNILPTGFAVGNDDQTDFITTYDFRDSINNKAYYTSNLDMGDSSPQDSPEEIASNSMPASPDDYEKLASQDNDLWITRYDDGDRNAQLYQFIVFKDNEISFYDPQDITQIYVEYQGFASPDENNVPLYLVIYNYRQQKWERLDSKDFRIYEDGNHCVSKINCSALDSETCGDYGSCYVDGYGNCYDYCENYCGNNDDCCFDGEREGACEWSTSPKDILQNTLVMDELYDPSSGEMQGFFTDYYMTDHLDDYIKDNMMSVMVYEENHDNTIYTDYVKVEVTTGDAKKYTFVRVDPLSENFDAFHSCEYTYPPADGPDLENEWEFDYSQYRKIADEFNSIKDRYNDWKDDGLHEYSWDYSWHTHVPTSCEQGYCTGDIPCDYFNDIMDCESTNGCDWTQIDEYECTGEVEEEACSYYTYSQCNIVPGCTWVGNQETGSCSGTPDSCEILTSFGQGKCLETPECGWTQVNEYECSGGIGDCSDYPGWQCFNNAEYCSWHPAYPSQHFVFTIGQDIERMYQMRVVWSGRYGEEMDDTAFFYIYNFDTDSWEFIDSNKEVFRDKTLVKTWYKGDLEKYIDSDGKVHLLAQTDKQTISTDNVYVDIIRDSFREMDSSLKQMQVKVDGKFSFNNEWSDAQPYTMWMSPSSHHQAGYANFYVKNDMDNLYILVDLIPDTTDEESCEENEEFNCQDIGNSNDCGNYYPICSWNETYETCYQSMSCAQYFYEHENCEMVDGYGNACYYYEYEEDYLNNLFNTDNDEQFEAAYMYGQACGLLGFESLFDLTEDDSFTLYRNENYDCGFHSNWENAADFTTSPNSDTPHRIWEYKLPIESFINYHNADKLKESIGMQLTGYGTLSVCNFPKAWTWPMNTYINKLGQPADDSLKLDATDASSFGQLNFADEYSLNQQWYYESTGKITEIAAGDYDGDGVDEVAAIDSGKNSVFVIDGYNVLWNLYPNYNGYAITSADLNNDGRDELIIGGSDGTNNGIFAFDVLNDKLLWAYYIGPPEEDWSEFIIDIEVAEDIDGYGNKAIAAITPYEDTLYVIDSEGEFMWDDDNRGGADIALGDFNGDGKDDVAVLTPGPSVFGESCYQDSDCGSSCCYKTGDSDYGYCAPSDFCIPDEEEDGGTVYIYDILTQSQISKIYVKTSYEFMLWFLYYGDQAMPYHLLKLDDLDGDGTDEVVVAGKKHGRNGVHVYTYDEYEYHNARRLWSYEPPESNFFYGFSEIAVADINDDGDKEVMAIDGMSVKSEEEDHTTVYIFDREGNLLETKPHSGFALATGDITNDGKQDLLVGANDGRLYVYNEEDPVWYFDTNIPEYTETKDYCICNYNDVDYDTYQMIKKGQCEYVPIKDYFICPINRLQCFEEDGCEWHQEDEVCPICGDGVCNGDETGCKNFAYSGYFGQIRNPQGFCPQDCGFKLICENEQRCGDNYCGGMENSENCPQDCKSNPILPDGYCQPHYGETCERNPWDCGISGKPGDVVRDIKVADVNGDDIKDTIVSAGNKLWILSSSLPVADIEVDKMVIKDTSIEFDGSKSHDPDGYLTSYIWDIGGNARTGSKTSLAFNQEGLYGAKLTVADNNGNKDTDSEIINVRPGIISKLTSTPEIDGIKDSEYDNGDIKELKFIQGIHKGQTAGKVYTLNDDQYIYFLFDLYGKDSEYADVSILFDTNFDMTYNADFDHDDSFYMDSNDNSESNGNHPEWQRVHTSDGHHIFEFAIPVEGLVNYRGKGPFYKDLMPIVILGDPDGDIFAWPEDVDNQELSLETWGLIDLVESPQPGNINSIWHYSQGTLRDIDTDGTNIAVITDNYQGSSQTIYLLDSSGNEQWSIPYEGDVVRIYGNYIVAGVNDYEENNYYVKAFDKSNGQEIWSYEIEESYPITDIEIGNFDGQDLVVAGDEPAGDTLYVLYLANGEEFVGPIYRAVNDIALGDIDGYGNLAVAIIAKDYGTYTFNGINFNQIWGRSDDGMAVDIGNLNPIDGNEVVIGGIGIRAISKDNSQLWYFETNSRVIDLALGDLNNDGYDDVVAITSQPYTTYALDGQTGALLWKKERSAPPEYKNRFQGGAFIARDLIHVANIGQDSANEVIIGAVDGNVYVYNNDGSINMVYNAGEWIEDIAIKNKDIVIGTSSASGNVIVISASVPPSTGPAGGGGGGGGGTGAAAITEKLTCPDWPADCPCGTRQTRQCDGITDIRECGKCPEEKPEIPTEVTKTTPEKISRPTVGAAFGALGTFMTENALGLLFLVLLIVFITLLILKREQIAGLLVKSRSRKLEKLIEKTQKALNERNLTEAHKLYTELSSLYNKHPEHIKRKYYETSYALYRQLKRLILHKRK